MTEFGEILKNVGEFGRFQKFLVFIMSFLNFFNAFHLFGQVFLGISVPHHCNISWILEKNPNLTEEQQLNLTIPHNTQGSYERCFMYTPVDWDIEAIERYGLNDTQGCQDGWVYDMSQQKATLVTEFDLVCNKKEQIDISQSIHMLGLLIGALIFGPLGDKIGRRPVILISIVLMTAFGVGAAFVTQFYVYMILRCFVGMAMSGIMINNLVLVAEWVGSSQRSYATIIGHVCFAVGLIVLSGVAYAIRDWRMLQVACAAPTGLLLCYIWLLPESPRWLLTKGKHKQAQKLLQKAAKINKREISEEILQQLQEEKQEKSGNITDLFKTPNLRKITLIMCCVWFVNSLVYYGLSLNVGSFGLDIYLTQLIFGAVEIPARVGAMFMVQYIGRKPSQAACLLFGGVVCLIVTAIPEDLSTVTTVLAVMGKFATASTYSICYIYAAELFPTVIRQNGVGLCSMTSRVGGIIAPLINLLAKYHRAIPMAIYGIAPIVGGVLSLFLPETNKKELQDYTQEVNNIPSFDSTSKEHQEQSTAEEMKSTHF
ncbi:solute carrier family 22 member 13-like [Hyperolius riggenbachi]|uniref:solute carrier family 22 member 13-like n=1 Tax=Hyperolius riggenbachi TaxID=752182 RepID=UPI0035A3C33A